MRSPSSPAPRPCSPGCREAAPSSPLAPRPRDAPGRHPVWPPRLRDGAGSVPGRRRDQPDPRPSAVATVIQHFQLRPFLAERGARQRILLRPHVALVWVRRRPLTIRPDIWRRPDRVAHDRFRLPVAADDPPVRPLREHVPHRRHDHGEARSCASCAISRSRSALAAPVGRSKQQRCPVPLCPSNRPPAPALHRHCRPAAPGIALAPAAQP